ncbi:MAG: hypothetical protein JJT95_03035 [Pararhodobacter sp.]|nr:hypothetical protein [Pararhodobacter sp.]
MAGAEPMETGIWLQADPQPGTLGEPVTFTATIRAADGTLRGAVEFREGDAVIGSANLSGLEPGPEVLSVGHGFNCALSATGAVMCWGANARGQLGDGTHSNVRYTPAPVQGLPGPARAVAAAGFSGCALIQNGAVWCWGDNIYGQLGDGTNEDRLTAVPVQGLPGPVRSIAAGFHHNCAVTEGDALWCWGGNGAGQLGDGTDTNRNNPVPVQGLQSGVRDVALGSYHSCALGWGGDAFCWGIGGRLGDGTTEGSLVPVPVQGLGRQNQAIAAGTEHSCALNRRGHAFCWGNNWRGQLGDGSSTVRLTPVRVHGLPGRLMTIVGGHRHSCAINRHQRTFCWGSNTYGQLGDGDTGYGSFIPVRARTGRVPTGVLVAHYHHNCLLGRAGGIQCWGWNQFSKGPRVRIPLPENVAGGNFAPAEGRGIAELVTDELPRGRRCVTAHYLGSDDHAPADSGERCLRITP